MTATALTAAAAKAINDNDDGGSGNNDDDDGDGENDDGDDDHLTCNDRIDGGRHGPPAPRGRTAAALSSPSGQAPSANANAQKQATLNSTKALMYAPLSLVKDGGSKKAVLGAALEISLRKKYFQTLCFLSANL